MRRIADEMRALEARLREGGGPEKIARQHKAGKLTARERVKLLLDSDSYFLEVGLLVAHDKYDGQAPAAGVVTGVGMCQGREIVVVANDATVKAGAWWPETIGKMLRAQEIAMRCRVPIVYLVDSAGVNLPYQGGVFPGQYGASRIFYYNSLMRRYLKIPQVAAVMGPCIAGGAYLPALSDVMLMVEGTSFMGLGGPNLVKGAIGQEVDAQVLGGAATHVEISGVAHRKAKNDEECITRIREMIADLPRTTSALPLREEQPPGRRPADAYDLVPDDHRAAYPMRELLATILDSGALDEFQPGHAPEMICGDAYLGGIPVGVLANDRGMFKESRGGPPKFGGILYTDSAEKCAYFIETCDRHRRPLLFVQDVSGFMVGTEAEHSGIIRAGARMVEAMACATVPKMVLTVNHASGAGYYAMAGQGFEPDFLFSWPTGRMGVMEGESAVEALFGPDLEEAKQKGGMDEALRIAVEKTRQDYERQLDARYAAARGFVDAILLPEDTRPALILALKACLNNPGSHIGPFVLQG
ncbi:MAG: acyl-CoA carboxylase subunit beta [Gemmatimonadetes bacterium]|nr:acyl-CoA carboxylase subunit beta [Gemmatimonadota bacterium]